MSDRGAKKLFFGLGAEKLWDAAALPKMPELRRLLEEGVPPDEYRSFVPRSRHPTAAPPL